MDPTVSVRGLCVTYPRRSRAPEVRALDHLDLEARSGEIIGVLGPNGSGKTTLLEVLGGAVAATAGNVAVLGRAPGDRSLVTAVGYQPDGALPFASLRAAELLAYLGDLMRLPRAIAARSAAGWLDRLDLQHAAKQPIGTFSAGMTRRLAIAAAMLADPEVLLLDEPTAGIDPEGSLTVLELLREKAEAGATVIMTSHHLQEVEQLCARVYVLHAGRCSAQGTLDELLGTGDLELVVRGLGDGALDRVRDAITAEGGQLLRVDTARRHLFALLRDMQRPTAKEQGDG